MYVFGSSTCGYPLLDSVRRRRHWRVELHYISSVFPGINASFVDCYTSVLYFLRIFSI